MTDGQRLRDGAERPSIGIYLHFPWCVMKCPYCDFNSHTATRNETDDKGISAYVDALIRDVDQGREALGAVSVHSVFLGGGTPSLFPASAVARVLDHLRATFKFLPNAEITLEANPGTADAAHFSGYRDAGVNRLSIGIQSLDDSSLKAIGRIHDASEGRKAVTLARAAGFDNLNLDMMYALPEQTPDEAQADLTRLIDLGPEHISWYQLTIEPGTRFARRPPSLPDDDQRWEIHLAGAERLAESGYAQYEVSAYARDGRYCRHNLGYWRFEDYLGFGAGAHGKYRCGDGSIIRESRVASPARYMESAGDSSSMGSNRVTGSEITLEYLMNALRLNAGFTTEAFVSQTGRSAEELGRALQPSIDAGLLTADKRWQCTARGRAHIDSILVNAMEQVRPRQTRSESFQSP